MVNLRELLARAVRAYTRRQLWTIFGYPQAIRLDEYWLRYRRDGIGGRVIRAYPDACWRAVPLVEDAQGSSADPASEEYSAFTAAWEVLCQEQAAVAYLARVDRLSRVGHYAILLLGFDDSADLDQPLVGEAALTYMAVYSERSAAVHTWDEDPRSARFGLPLTYRVNPRPDHQSDSNKRAASSFVVHWTRVIHVAENLDEDEVFGEPALRPIWNNLLDLEKVAGSGAETYWLNARGGLAIEAEAGTRLNEAQVSDIKTQLDDYMNDMRRTLALHGAKVSAIATPVVDPKPNAELQLQLIGGRTGIPQRLLVGSERGELASTTDSESWDARVNERCVQHCGPNILTPFIERMIETGNLPAPVGEWRADWPESATMTELQRMEVAYKRVQAAHTWALGAADRAMALPELRLSLGLEATSEYDLADDIADDEDTLGDDLDPVPPPPEDEDPEEDDQ